MIDKSILDKSSLCSRCNYCYVCPIYSADGWESSSPRGKLYILKCISEKSLSLDAEVLNELFKCTTCGSCEVACQVEIPLINLWESLRANLNKNGYVLPVHKKLKERAIKEWNPYGESKGRRADWFNLKVNKDSEILYFAGCTTSYRTAEIAKSTVEIFSKVGLEFNYAGVEEYCCGSPFFRTGQLDIAEKLFLKNFRVWKGMGVKKIVTSCAGCYRTIAADYPALAEKYNYNFDFEVIHTVEILNDILKDVDLNELNITATYHDPCHLGRHMGIYDEPRNVMKKLGVNLIEMERNRENAFCCGAGGGVRSQFKELSFEIGKLRSMDVLETKADYLVSCCPFCKLHLSQSLKSLNKEVVVVDLVEIVNESLNGNVLER